MLLRLCATALLCFALIACDRGSEVPPGAPPAASAPAKPAGEPGAAITRPTLRIDTLDGTSYSLEERRGKWVVVNFWATWCAPCLKEMPELSALDEQNEHIEVIGLAYEDIDVPAMRAFLEAHPVKYPIAIVDVGNPPAAFETPRGLPMTYLIAPDGRVAQKFLGPVTGHELEEAIAKAGGPAPASA